MARKTKAEAEKTRQQLLDSALQLFSEQGPAQVTLTQIATHAGTTRGAIYWHFKDKCALLDCLWEETITPIEQAFNTLAASEPEDRLESLRQLAAGFLNSLVTTTRMHQIFRIIFQAWSLPELSDGLNSLHCEQRNALKDYLQPLAEQGELRDGLTAELAATLFLSSVDGLLNHWLFSTDPVEIEDNIEPLTLAWIAMISRH